MDKSQSILFVVRGNNTLPSCRFRAYNYQKHFETLGIKSDFLIVEQSKNIFKQIAFYFKLPFISRKYDAVVYQKLTEPLRIFLMSLTNRNLYYDFDDAMYLTEGTLKFALTMLAAPKVIAGNGILQKKALRYNRNCIVIPTVVEIPNESNLQAITHQPSSTCILSWIGTARNLQYLTPIYDAVEELYLENKNILLNIVSDTITSIPDKAWIRAEKWNFENEHASLSSCTIGLMPLSDDPWSQGKCACKALQYLSYKKPVITSPVGLNKDLFESESFGSMATTKQQWKSAIESYINNTALLETHGQQGYAFVDENYNIEKWALTLAKILLPRNK